MAITIANLVTNFDTYIGDSSNDRVTAVERLQYFTEATVWLQEELENDLQVATYNLDYFDTINYYKVTTAVADLLEGADLRREKDAQTRSFAPKSSRELAEEIGQMFGESSWAIERRDTNTYLVINHASTYNAKIISRFDSLTNDGGTWAVDATNSDATNLTIDSNEFKEGSSSFNFDMDENQSGNSKLEIVNSDLSAHDLSTFEDISSFLFWAYIPDVSATIFSSFDSFTLYWGSSTSAYWSATVTTDVEGAAWVDGWNRVKVDWSAATKTGSPDVTAINYIQIDFNYTNPTGDDTDFRLDELIIVRPEKLVFHYLSWNVGTNTGGTDVTVFGATTDIPYFSGMYDQYKYTVAHKAASLAFKALRLRNESVLEEDEAEQALIRARKIFPTSRVREVKSFKVIGVNFARIK